MTFRARIVSGSVFAIIGFLPVAVCAAPYQAGKQPVDKPTRAVTSAQVSSLERATQPYVAKARKTYPAAKKRFLAGLPRGQQFFITTTLRDTRGAREAVFILVRSIKKGIVSGLITNDIETVKGFRRGQAYAFPELQVQDWLIKHADGTEEGNVVGKFLDTYQQPPATR